jgi:hypothetical protein
MTIANWATLLVAISTLIGSFALSVRFLVKHFLYELKPNGGTSLKDSVSRLEAQMEIVLGLLEKKK